MTATVFTWLRYTESGDEDRTQYHKFRTDAQAIDWLLQEISILPNTPEALEVTDMLEHGEFVEIGDGRWIMGIPPDTSDHTQE